MHERAFTLPAPASTFVGRERELVQGERHLDEGRILTITGTGGAGKTRFAVELARRAFERQAAACAHGVFGAYLAPLRDPQLVLPTICRAVGVQEMAGRTALECLSSHLRGKRALVLVDNVEHLPAAAGEVSKLAAACPQPAFLVTSREPLRIDGERVYELPVLDLGDGVALFCERARVAPDDTIRELCLRLEGLPLAIELAAARVPLVTPSQLLERLSRRLDILRGGQDRDPRQQTLRATIRWSYDLLSPAEQHVFASMSVFVGGCPPQALEQVCGPASGSIESLVEKGLARRAESELGVRYSMLETMREFAFEALVESGGLERARIHMRNAFLALAEELAHDRYGDATVDERRRFDADAANFREVLSHAIADEDAAVSLRLVRVLGDYWYWSPGREHSYRLVESALALTGGKPDDRAHALHRASRLAAETGRIEEFRALSAASEAGLVAAGDAHGEFQVLQERATFEAFFGEYERAVDDVERAYALARRLGDPWSESLAAQLYGVLLAERAAARGFAEPDLLDRVQDLFAAPLREARADCTAFLSFPVLANYSVSLLLLGRAHEALGLFGELVRATFWRHQPSGQTWTAWLFLGVAATEVGRHRDGALFLELGTASSEERDEPLPKLHGDMYNGARARAAEALGAEEYEQVAREARPLTFEEATERALALTEPYP